MSSEKNLEAEYVELSRNFSLSTGLLVLGDSQNNSIISHPAPTTLYPTPIPKILFEGIHSIQPLLNELMDNVSLDQDFFLSILEPIAKVDDFIKNLIDIYKNTSQPSIRFGIFRSDYLLDYQNDAESIDGNDVLALENFFEESIQKNLLSFKQVEFNTIASSFGALSTKTTELHRFLLKRTFGYNNKFSLENLDARIPSNKALDSLAEGLAKAHSLGPKESAILFVVQDGEKNILDQRFLEFELFTKFGIRVLRRSMNQLYNIELDASNQLLIDGQLIKVVYFRAGYAPYDFNSDKDWKVRLLLEQSDTIKCPSIAYHLIGSKKVQQVLAQPEILEKFITNKEDADRIRSFFTGLYPLDQSSDGDKALQLALTNPERYVLKPSREGGGNNHYNDEIPKLLNSLDRVQISQFILMDKIRPPKFINNNVGLRAGNVNLRGDFVTEVGVYGVYLASGEKNNKKVLVNNAAGHLLRTKLNSTNEGGVAVGHAVIDSPYLV